MTVTAALDVRNADAAGLFERLQQTRDRRARDVLVKERAQRIAVSQMQVSRILRTALHSLRELT
jgi:DNA-directed RNA polymerase specialized sigma subunit